MKRFCMLWILLLSAWALATDVDSLYELYQVRDSLSGTYVLTGNIDMEDTNPATKPAAWSKDTTYAIGERVTHTKTATERTYFAKRETVGDEPDDTDTDDWRVGWTTSDGWLPIGTSGAPFTGTFTGTGYTLSNMVIVRPTTDYVGLFGSCTTGSLTGITMTGGAVSGQGYVGFLAGRTFSSVTSCSSTGTVGGTGSYIGGLLGYHGVGNVTSCYATGAVTGTDNDVGGFVGYNTAIVTKCYATGTVSGTGHAVGGFVGWNTATGDISSCYATGSSTMIGINLYACGGFAGYSNGIITNCYSKGAVSGIYSVAGFIGEAEGSVTNCYSIGTVTGTTKSGFCHANSGTVTNCYWDTTTSGIGTSTVGTGFATAYMVYPYESGDDPPINAAKPYYTWPLGSLWKTDYQTYFGEQVNGGYPILDWQYPTCIIGQ